MGKKDISFQFFKLSESISIMRLKVLLILLVTISINSFSQYKIKTNNTELFKPGYKSQSIYDIVNVPEEEISIGFWALVIAKEYDSLVDVEKYLKILDEMTEEIKRMLAGRDKDMDKFLAVKMFLYEPGIWNQNKPFSYDLNDPLGNTLEHQLLSNYIDTRKGNCVSMPTLFLALMERVDPNVKFFGVKAPLHLFCRLRDKQTGDVWNIETTNGGNPARNQWYIDHLNISQTALENKLYLEDLTKKEYIAELIGTLIAKERKKGNFEEAMKYADLVLKLTPNSDLGLVSKGALYAEIGYKKSRENELSEIEKKYYHDEAEKCINKAKSLGWKPPSNREREEYLNSVKTELKKHPEEK